MSLPGRFWRLYASSATSNLADGVGRVALPLLAVPLNVGAATRATLAVKPSKILDGSSITVSAAHLQPKHVFTFMLVGPKVMAPHWPP